MINVRFIRNSIFPKSPKKKLARRPISDALQRDTENMDIRDIILIDGDESTGSSMKGITATPKTGVSVNGKALVEQQQTKNNKTPISGGATNATSTDKSINTKSILDFFGRVPKGAAAVQVC